MFFVMLWFILLWLNEKIEFIFIKNRKWILYFKLIFLLVFIVFIYNINVKFWNKVNCRYLKLKVYRYFDF